MQMHSVGPAVGSIHFYFAKCSITAAEDEGRGGIWWDVTGTGGLAEV